MTPPIDQASSGLTSLWAETYGESDLAVVAERVVAALRNANPYCLWLHGPLGAGKTTLTGFMLRRLGLSDQVPVTSPTFTYVNEYKIGDRWYAHLDLYRTDARLTLEDLGIADTRPFSGLFVEWAERRPNDPHIRPTHILNIAMAEGGKRRLYTLQGATT